MCTKLLRTDTHSLSSVTHSLTHTHSQRRQLMHPKRHRTPQQIEDSADAPAAAGVSKAADELSTLGADVECGTAGDGAEPPPVALWAAWVSAVVQRERSDAGVGARSTSHTMVVFKQIADLRPPYACRVYGQTLAKEERPRTLPSR